MRHIRPWHIGEVLVENLFKRFISVEDRVRQDSILEKFRRFNLRAPVEISRTFLDYRLKQLARHSGSRKFDGMHRVDIILELKTPSGMEYIAVEVKMGMTGQSKNWNQFKKSNFKVSNNKVLNRKITSNSNTTVAKLLLENVLAEPTFYAEPPIKDPPDEAIFRLSKAAWVLVVHNDFLGKDQGAKLSDRVEAFEEFRCIVIEFRELLSAVREIDGKINFDKIVADVLTEGELGAMWGSFRKV